MGKTMRLLPFSVCMKYAMVTFTVTLYYSLLLRQKETTEHFLCRTLKINLGLYRVPSVNARGVLLSEPSTLFRLTGPDEWNVAS